MLNQDQTALEQQRYLPNGFGQLISGSRTHFCVVFVDSGYTFNEDDVEDQENMTALRNFCERNGAVMCSPPRWKNDIIEIDENGLFSIIEADPDTYGIKCLMDNYRFKLRY